MADWRDVMTARSEADYALNEIDRRAPYVTVAVAITSAARVVALELRALSVLIDHARGDAR